METVILIIWLVSAVFFHLPFLLVSTTSITWYLFLSIVVVVGFSYFFWVNYKCVTCTHTRCQNLELAVICHTELLFILEVKVLFVHCLKVAGTLCRIILMNGHSFNDLESWRVLDQSCLKFQIGNSYFDPTCAMVENIMELLLWSTKVI